MLRRLFDELPLPTLTTPADVVWETLAAHRERLGVPHSGREELLRQCFRSAAFRRSTLRPAFDLYYAITSSAIASRPPSTMYDIVVVGGGMLSLHLIEAVRARGGDLRILVIEAERGASAFADVGDAYRLNTDAPHTEPLGSIDYCADSPFGLASICHDALRAGWLLTRTDVWCAARVMSASRADDGWSLGVAYRGQEHIVRGAHVVIATGFGEPLSRSLPRAARSRAMASPSTCDDVPAMLTAKSMLAHASWGSLAKARWWRDGARVVVTGSGPSAFCAFEALLGLGPKELVDFTALDSPRFVLRWATGLAGPTSVSHLKKRFAASAAADSTARMLVSRYGPCWDTLAALEETGALKVTQGNVKATASSGVVYCSGEPVDAVIDCTGYPPSNVPVPFDITGLQCVNDALEGERITVLGDCVREAFREDLDAGPLQQWARAARLVGTRLGGNEPAGPRWTVPLPPARAAAHVVPEPPLPTIVRHEDHIGAAWLLRLLSALIGSDACSAAAPGAIQIPAALDFSEAVAPRTASVLARALPGTSVMP